jgi:hypothetical protein
MTNRGACSGVPQVTPDVLPVEVRVGDVFGDPIPSQMALKERNCRNRTFFLTNNALLFGSGFVSIELITDSLIGLEVGSARMTVGQLRDPEGKVANSVIATGKSPRIWPRQTASAQCTSFKLTDLI